MIGLRSRYAIDIPEYPEEKFETCTDETQELAYVYFRFVQKHIDDYDLEVMKPDLDFTLDWIVKQNDPYCGADFDMIYCA